MVGKASLGYTSTSFKAFGRGGGFHHGGDQFHAVTLGGAGKTVESRIGGAGFQASGAVVIANQFIRVGQLEFSAPQRVHPECGEAADIRVIQNQLPGHEGDIVS